MDDVRAICDTVLYEGYLLWPYRKSALKNQRRWTIGSLAAPGCDPSLATEAAASMLLETPENSADVRITMRFLHLVERDVVQDGESVPQVRVSGQLYQSGEESAEREVTLDYRVGEDEPAKKTFTIDGGSCEQPAGEASSVVLRRRWQRLTGELHIACEPVLPGVHRINVRLCNTTTPQRHADPRVHGFTSAHVVLHCAAGGFVSAIDPPESLRDVVAASSCEGLYPVLIGQPGATDTILAAPIVLYDWPQVSPESPGDLFDSTEIDRLLVLSVLSMTPAEQEEMAATDPKAREILNRCSALSTEDLLRLHGTLRDVAKEVW